MANIIVSRTLEEVKADPSLKQYMGKVRIWSNEWNLWWGKNSNGYTDNKNHAGIYTIEEALKKSGHCGPEKGIVYYHVYDQDDPEGYEKLGKAYADIKIERVRQDSLWGEQNHHPMEWLSILGEEFGEVCKAACEAHFKYENGETWEDYRKELVHTAAVAVSMIECFDRNRDKGESE